ncbi:hypothetical protein AB0F77_35240 [Streptomyces sp. NPDC026672]|uniref:hypothetical protein n=1 Tax=unclassified Streptomyces TaxID=2593676 RepID=UPI0033EA1A76
MKKTARRTAAAALGAVALATATVGTGATSAQAATPWFLEVCASGGYALFVESPALGIHAPVDPLRCFKTGIQGIDGNPSFEVKVYVRTPTNSTSRYIASALYRGDQGLTLYTAGTADNPYMYPV